MPNKPTKSSKILKPALSLFFSVFFIPLTGLPACAESVPRQTAIVEKALTGDTIQLRGGKTLKYIGLESYPLQSKVLLVRECGEKARAFNDSLVAGRKVSLEWGSRIRDKRDNLLAYVFLEDGRFVNQEIISAGHAKTRILAPNLAYAAELRDAESKARQKKRGLWEKEPDNPFGDSQYIGEKNTKLYYRPNSPELERIPEAQLVRFRSRVDAKAAGYRACPTCREASPDESE